MIVCFVCMEHHRNEREGMRKGTGNGKDKIEIERVREKGMER